jgi:hypothetical protein
VEKPIHKPRARPGDKVTSLVVVVLGLIMAARWIGVYRAYSVPDSSRMVRVPPERHFPRSVVAIHGALAGSTLVLILLSVLFDGS